MSLDITLHNPTTVTKKGTGVYIRENGATRELQTVEEVKTYFPDADLTEIQETSYDTDIVFTGNVTHNLGEMAEKADLYHALWRPYRLISGDKTWDSYDAEREFEDSTVIKAQQLIDPLFKGLEELKAHPKVYEALNPKNGWGNYEQLKGLTRDYLIACLTYPDAIVEVDR